MNYTGKWIFHSTGSFGHEGGMVYLNAEEYLKDAENCVDADDDAFADEMKERRNIVESSVEVLEDGTLYLLVPIPADVSKEELDEAVEAGEIAIRNGMIAQGPIGWEEREDELWLALEDMSEDGFVKATDGEFLVIGFTRYVKEQ